MFMNKFEQTSMNCEKNGSYWLIGVHSIRDDARICNFLTRDRTCQSHPVLYKIAHSLKKKNNCFLATNSITAKRVLPAFQVGNVTY